jgi:hypothetical protein
MVNYLTQLCYYDIRNPDNCVIEFEDVKTIEQQEDCMCDNCFYGRTTLALIILDLKKGA